MNTLEKNMAARILRFEDDRATGPASLRVRRLPAADKGGNYEICGICDGIEPATYKRIKTLLDSGQRQEAWDACLEYMWKNTRAVRDWTGSDTHPATEFYLRDHYFNSGSKNTLKILQRALNDSGAHLTVDGLIGPKTRAALRDRLVQPFCQTSAPAARPSTCLVPSFPLSGKDGCPGRMKRLTTLSP